MAPNSLQSLDKRFEDLQTYLVVLLLPAIAVVEVLTRLFIVAFPKIYMAPAVLQPDTLMAFGIVGTVLIIYDWIIRIKNRSFKLGVAEYFYIAMIVFTILSMVFSQNDSWARQHEYYTREGPEHFLAYYWLFYAGTRIRSDKYRVSILKSFLVVCIINAVVATLQSFGVGRDIIINSPPIYEGMNFAFGLTINPNNYGGLSVLLTACASGAFIFREHFTKSKLADVALLILSCVLLYTSFASRARLAIVGDVAFVIFFIIALAIMRKSELIKRFAILLGAFTIVVLVTIFFTDFIVANVQRTTYEMTSDDVSFNLGSQRLYLLQYALESVKDNWAFGVGIDNFEQVFYNNPKWSEGMFCHSLAHNEYIHILATQGVFAFATHVGAMIYAIITSVRKITKEYDSKSAVLTWIFLGMLIGYMAKAIFACSVINVAPYAWIVLGLCFTTKEKTNE